LTGSDQHEIQVAIVIEIDEDRFARSLRLRNARFRRYVDKRPISTIAKKAAASVTTDDEQIQPTIVVVVRESGKRSALREGDARAYRRVPHESALNAIEIRD
jgi:hypothetical protein